MFSAAADLGLNTALNGTGALQQQSVPAKRCIAAMHAHDEGMFILSTWFNNATIFVYCLCNVEYRQNSRDRYP